MAAAAMVVAEQAEANRADLLWRLGRHFARVEVFRQAGKYLRALMADLPRKNCWTLAEYAGDATPDKMQRLLARACWDQAAVMATVRAFVVEHLHAPGLTVLVLDESGVEKTGTATAGVKRQYVGCAGKVANAVNLVNATYSSPTGHALIGSRIYLPAEQLADPDTAARMGIPAGQKFATKPQLGRGLLAETLAAGIAVGWCAADSVYGRDGKLRQFCERNRVGYVFGVPCSFRVNLNLQQRLRVDATVEVVGAHAWQIASCGAGSKGERYYAWVWLATVSPRHFLLIRRSLTKPTDLAYFYCHVPDGMPATLGVLIAVAGRRWTVEEDHEFGKDQFGFDHFQARRHTPILRHITLVTAALAIFAVTAAAERQRTGQPPVPIDPDEAPPADPGLIALTVVEIKRLFNLLARVRHDDWHHLHWSIWKRRHQARARWYHHRARLRRVLQLP